MFSRTFFLISSQNKVLAMSQLNFRIVGSLAVSLGAFVSMLLQLHAIMLMWKMHVLRRNEMCLRALLRRRRYFLQKNK